MTSCSLAGFIVVALAVSSAGQFLNAPPGRQLATCGVAAPLLSLSSEVLASFTAAAMCKATVPTTVIATTVAATTVTGTTPVPTTVTTIVTSTATFTTVTVVTTVTTVTVVTTVTTTTGCITMACGASGYSSTEACNAMLAGSSQASCKRKTNDAMLSSCLSETFKLSCPAGNNMAGAVPDFQVASGLQCKPCSTSPIIKDIDPRAQKIAFALSFGDLMDSSNESVANIASYEVWTLHSNGRPNAKMATMPALSGVGGKCCKGDRYTWSVKADISAGYQASGYFGITAISKVGARLPILAVFNRVADLTKGEVAIINGEFAVKMSALHAAAVAANAGSKQAFGKALAATIDGVSAGNVFVTEIWVNDQHKARRLESRRLADVTVKIVYEIISSDSTKSIAASDINGARLKTNIQTEQATIGDSITITGTPIVSAPIVNVVGYDGRPGLAGAASALVYPCLVSLLVLLSLS